MLTSLKRYQNSIRNLSPTGAYSPKPHIQKTARLLLDKGGYNTGRSQPPVDRMSKAVKYQLRLDQQQRAKAMIGQQGIGADGMPLRDLKDAMEQNAMTGLFPNAPGAAGDMQNVIFMPEIMATNQAVSNKIANARPYDLTTAKTNIIKLSKILFECMDSYKGSDIIDCLMALGIDCGETSLRRIVDNIMQMLPVPENGESKILGMQEIVDLGVGDQKTNAMMNKLRDLQAQNIAQLEEIINGWWQAVALTASQVSANDIAHKLFNLNIFRSKQAGKEALAHIIEDENDLICREDFFSIFDKALFKLALSKLAWEIHKQGSSYDPKGKIYAYRRMKMRNKTPSPDFSQQTAPAKQFQPPKKVPKLRRKKPRTKQKPGAARHPRVKMVEYNPYNA